MRYKITVKTIKNNVLNFSNVDSYKILEGDFIKFTDSRTGRIKIFHSSNTEIEEVFSNE